MSRAQRALASAADAAASGGGCYGKSHAEAWAESAALEQWADELEELAELAAAAEDADGSDQDEPKSARTSTASCELPLSSRYARVIGDVQDAVYRADDRQRGDIPRLAAHRGHSFKMLSDRATATAATAAAAALLPLLLPLLRLLPKLQLRPHHPARPSSRARTLQARARGWRVRMRRR